MPPPGQAALAQQLGTTVDGTDWIGQVTGVLNANLHAGWYVTREMPNDPPTQQQRDLLWHDVVRAIDDGFPLVANIVAPPSNHPPGYPNTTIYHYFTVIGYNPQTRAGVHRRLRELRRPPAVLARVRPARDADPTEGLHRARRLCARCRHRPDRREVRLRSAAAGRYSGAPITEERGTPDGIGRFSVFEQGSIYWTPALGAHEVHGRIREAWAAAGWETGRLGYPISDEYADGDGRRSDFEHGYIHWSAATDTMTIGP